MVAWGLVLATVARLVGDMAQLSTKLPWELANTKWAASINPVLALPILSGVQLNGVVLAANVPLTINHLLQRLPQGWIVTDNTANTSIWRTAELNKYTITLEASADTTIAIWIY